MIHSGSNPDVYVTWRDEFRGSQDLQTSQNHELVLGVCSVPARDMRQNQPQVDAVARAAVPNFIDDGAGSFEHEARASADLSLLFVAGR